MYQIQKEFHFSAAHQLKGLPEDHQCSRLHGHNYIVVMVLEARTLNAVGFVRDYGELKIVKTFLDRVFDHRNLNEVLDPFQTSAEVIAMLLFGYFIQTFPELYEVRVSETPSTWASYRNEFREFTPRLAQQIALYAHFDALMQESS